ncbi:unnamed protein product [Polarella glacialis]|uniref:LTD domain-containing protein n=1 Tax=Polarella glacialis TaxID=89957 RepID=A0A813ENR0_POLGL|nr:unnamed protein product [Polarella glacialis]CAE8638146.1 unnamed protein product [Polarella glacialis]
MASAFLRLTVAAVNVRLFFSGFAEGSSNNKYLEIYNAGTESANLGDWAFPTVSNGPTTPGVHENWNNFTAGAVLEPGKVYVIAHGSADQKILDVTNQTYTYLSNGDDGVKLAYGTEADHVYLHAVGDFQADPGTGWDICGEAAGTVDHTLVRKTSVTAGNPDWDASRGTTADNCEWVVYPKDEWKYVGVHQGESVTTPTEAVLNCSTASPVSISKVQGNGSTSPMVGEVVVLKGVVTADLQGTYGGFFMQEIDGGDNDSSTSDGIYVSDASVVVSQGD